MGKKKWFLYSAFLIFFTFCLRSLLYFHLDVSDDEFTGVQLCPACYGTNLCPKFYHGEINLLGISSLKYLQFFNQKNVFTGKFRRERVVLKKLAHNWEITEADAFLCKVAKLDYYCKVNEAIKLLIKNNKKKGREKLLNVFNSFKTSSDISQCPTERLLSYIFSKLNADTISMNESELNPIYKIAEMMYSILINPEAVILQAFSQMEGWPFPHYYGACGRVIVVEHAGKSLGSYEDSSWEQRVDIAYQLLLISQMLTENALDFALYMTDVNMDNFALRMDGTLLLVDVENIVIVDRLNARKGKEPSDLLHHSKGEFCADCLNFSFEDFCHHDLSDHNYYAICKGLLVPNAYYSERGLLHGIPSDVNRRTNLSSLLEECANPHSHLGRFRVVPQMLQVLKSLL